MINLQIVDKSRGFTLIEVMIALTIFAVIAVSVGRSASIYIKNAARLELKTQALNIAEYELSQILFEDRFLPAKETKKDVEIQGRSWVITQKVTLLPNPNLQQVDVSVSEKGDTFGEDYSIITISGFIGRN